LKAGLWFRRTRFVIVAPDVQPSWPLSGKNSTYPAVQICRASSHRRVMNGPSILALRAIPIKRYDAIFALAHRNETPGSLAFVMRFCSTPIQHLVI
jgi:hypothetical protein